MSTIQRLHLSHKFMILGLLALLMAVIPTALYVNNALTMMAKSRQEAEGTAPVIALQKVVQLMQQHRGLSAGMLSGNDTLAARRPGVATALTQAMLVVDGHLADGGATAAAASNWGDLKKRWTELEQAVVSRQLKTAESTQQHTRLIAALMLLSETLKPLRGTEDGSRLCKSRLRSASSVSFSISYGCDLAGPRSGFLFSFSIN